MYVNVYYNVYIYIYILDCVFIDLDVVHTYL